MNCTDIYLLLSGHIDGVNTAEEEQALQAHLAGCKECRNLLSAYETINSNTALLEEPAPAGLKAAVMAEITGSAVAAPKKAKTGKPWLGIAISAGLVAAAAALVFGIGFAKNNGVSKDTARKGEAAPAVKEFTAEAPAAPAEVFEAPAEKVEDAAPEMPAKLFAAGPEAAEAPAAAAEPTKDAFAFEPEAAEGVAQNDYRRPAGLTAAPEEAEPFEAAAEEEPVCEPEEPACEPEVAMPAEEPAPEEEPAYLPDAEAAVEQWGAFSDTYTENVLLCFDADGDFLFFLQYALPEYWEQLTAESEFSDDGTVVCYVTDIDLHALMELLENRTGEFFEAVTGHQVSEFGYWGHADWGYTSPKDYEADAEDPAVLVILPAPMP